MVLPLILIINFNSKSRFIFDLCYKKFFLNSTIFYIFTIFTVSLYNIYNINNHNKYLYLFFPQKY